MNIKNANKIFVNTDGGARGNPGPAAIGVVIKDAEGTTIKSYQETIGERTNNEAEYEAVILALRKIKSLLGGGRIKETEITVRMDSLLVASQLRGEYKIEEERLQPLFMRVWNLRMDFGKINFQHIPREKNKEADSLVNDALDRKQEIL